MISDFVQVSVGFCTKLNATPHADEGAHKDVPGDELNPWEGII